MKSQFTWEPSKMCGYLVCTDSSGEMVGYVRKLRVVPGEVLKYPWEASIAGRPLGWLAATERGAKRIVLRVVRSRMLKETIRALLV